MPETWPQRVRYAFSISGDLSERALSVFPELSVSDVPGPYTMLYGPVAGPSELRGLLARFDSLGLVVVEMRRLPD
ncbi:hypothetical protein DW322_05690 [Rhodococcus rhodnii]|nr:hypothetical protein [Rhodococcus rhodnii]TXG89798.1 hypothetical protein DW322_05690 [Rhodococcus rhodnii]